MLHVMDFWSGLLDLVLLVLGALALGLLAERLRQSAILGYLAAGTLLGPHGLNWIKSEHDVALLAELGVALLLFTIGLEFSLKRLRRMGKVALWGGFWQIVLTLAGAAVIAMSCGLGWRSGVALGAIIAMSSTACVLRVLTERAEVDTPTGRGALGVLLMQDVMVVPLVLLVSALGGDAGIIQALGELCWSLALLVVFVLLVLGMNHYLLPRLLGAAAVSRNRELPILLAVALCLGATWSAHQVHLSPALGAFIAGLLLGDSPFAVQVRSDVAAFKTLFVTLFFLSVGMLSDPRWALAHWPTVTSTVVAVMVGKAVIAGVVLAWLTRSTRVGLASGLVLAQIGEFGFVLAQLAKDQGVLDDELFKLLAASTVVTLFLTPLVAVHAGRLAAWVDQRLPFTPKPQRGGADSGVSELTNHLVVVGFGPAGREAANAARAAGTPVLVVEMNPQAIDAANQMGLHTQMGDAARLEVLEHLRLPSAAALVVTLPDHRAALQVIHRARSLAPGLPMVVRARYALHAGELDSAGVTVVNEEVGVGQMIRRELRRYLLASSAKTTEAGEPALPGPQKETPDQTAGG